MANRRQAEMIERLTDFLSVDRRNGYHFYLKTPVEGFYIRRPAKEAEAYRELSRYFQMPKARMAGDTLVVRGIDSPSAEKLICGDCDTATRTLDRFVDENIRMWEDTTRPMCEPELGRNWREETLKTARRLLEEPKFAQVAGLPLSVNGEKYPGLGQTLSRIIRRLESNREPNMALCHGDEHLANLIPAGGGHFVIDPGNWTGMNTPSSAYNNIAGANHLFFYRYDGSANAGEVLDIRFSPKQPFTGPRRALGAIEKRLLDWVDKYQGGDSFARDFLAVNCFRCAVGWIQRSMDLKDILETGFIYAGIGTQMYYETGR